MVFALSISNCLLRDALEAAITGGSAMITCALVPPTPKLLTPAMRGVPVRGQAVLSWATRKGEFAKSMAGFGFSKPMLAGIFSC